MKKFKSKTKNRGTTIILEDCQEAIEITDKFLGNSERFFKKITYFNNTEHGNIKYKEINEYFRKCKEDIVKGDQKFKEAVENIVEDILGIVDDIQPIFSQSKQGYIRTEGDQGITATPELLMQGEELCAFKRKSSAEQKVKRGSGEGSYRILINTDVSWWGNPEMNCGLVGAIIILLQRYAPVEVWIQQGWLGNNIKDGVTLFKLDYTAATDLTSLAFWICHPYKDNIFSWAVNKALDRDNSVTSCVAEIECDIMLRGDWFLKEGVSYQKIHNSLYTEQIDLMAKWIAATGYKVLYEDGNNNLEIQDI